MGPPQIRFDFDLFEAAWDQSFEKLRQFTEGNGGVAHVLRDDPAHPGLGSWCDKQVRRPTPPRQLTEPGRCCSWTVSNPEGGSASINCD